MRGIAGMFHDMDLIHKPTRHASSTAWLILLLCRCLHSDKTLTQDLVIEFILEIWLLFITTSSSSQSPSSLLWRTFFGFFVWKFLDHYRITSKEISLTRKSTTSDVAWTKPLVFPCRTTHARLFPKKHSFSYSYLFVGVPVGWQGRAGTLLSADGAAKRGWLHVDPADYLERDLQGATLREKVDHYLVTQV